ncbi:hypothetical protein, partial [uncultured Prevotella sp.]|uniref:hypothetical protein n=1 Tax=uncultured Prevotella sp. TaxID=159272 RepID=UPI00259B5FD7
LNSITLLLLNLLSQILSPALSKRTFTIRKKVILMESNCRNTTNEPQYCFSDFYQSYLLFQ